VVHGVNVADPEVAMISCASCTTNAITPVVEVMGRRIGIRKAIMTTVHAYTSTQAIVDGPAKRMRRGRAAAANLVPASTGAAIATTKALPQYEGKFDGTAIRAPVPVGSIADVTFVTERATTVDEVNTIFREEAESNRYSGILGVTEDPIVSADIVMDPRASVVDLQSTQVVDGDLVKVMSWYDNEWGYAAQMVREAKRMSAESRVE
jgi:glyceraldehyde 3-phosphate dehydrogenase